MGQQVSQLFSWLFSWLMLSSRRRLDARDRLLMLPTLAPQLRRRECSSAVLERRERTRQQPTPQPTNSRSKALRPACFPAGLN